MQKPVTLKVNGLILRGMMHMPDNQKKKHPFVALYHGFSGTSLEPQFKFVTLSRELAKAGIGSVRFDYSGSGESDGRFEDMTIYSEINEAKAIYVYMARLPLADPANLFILGYSLSGFIASYIAPNLPGLKGLTLWCPSIRSTLAYFDKQQKGLPKVAGGFDHHGLKIGKGYYNSRKRILKETGDFFTHAAQFKGPVCILHGTGDQITPFEIGQKLWKSYGRQSAKLVKIPGADHGFSSLSWKEMLIRESVAFIKKTAQRR